MEKHTGIGLVGSMKVPSAGICGGPGGIGIGEEEGQYHGRAGTLMGWRKEACLWDARLDGGREEEEDGDVDRRLGPGHPYGVPACFSSISLFNKSVERNRGEA